MKDYINDQYWGDAEQFFKDLERKNQRVSVSYNRKLVDERIYHDLSHDEVITEYYNYITIDDTLNYFEYKGKSGEVGMMFGVAETEGQMIGDFKKLQSAQLSEFITRGDDLQRLTSMNKDDAIADLYDMMDCKLDIYADNVSAGYDLDKMNRLLSDLIYLCNVTILINEGKLK